MLPWINRYFTLLKPAKLIPPKWLLSTFNWITSLRLSSRVPQHSSILLSLKVGFRTPSVLSVSSADLCPKPDPTFLKKPVYFSVSLINLWAPQWQRATSTTYLWSLHLAFIYWAKIKRWPNKVDICVVGCPDEPWRDGEGVGGAQGCGRVGVGAERQVEQGSYLRD